jgi:hypothetical protein
MAFGDGMAKGLALWGRATAPQPMGWWWAAGGAREIEMIGMFPLFYRFQLPGRDPTYGYHGLWARSQMGIVRLPLDSSVLLLFLGSFNS